MGTKQCTKCGEVKPLDQYSPNGRGRLKSECKACHRAQKAKQRAENPEKYKAKDAEWRSKNPEKHKTKVAKWRHENPEKAKASRAKWRYENPDKYKEMQDKRVKFLTPAYVANVLRAPITHLTPELLEAKREQLLNVRVTRQLLQTLKDLQNVQ